MSDDDARVEPRMSPGGVDVRDPLPRAVRDPSFPVSVRGYERHAVDAYVERVNRLIAELQVSGSPRAAVRHALERVGEQTSGILQRARETAEEITTGAREEAEETTGRARAEAEEIVAEARREAGERAAGARAEADEVVAGARAAAEEALTSARDQSDSMVARARIEAEGRVRRAEEEVAELQEQAAARMEALQADIAAISEERGRLVEGLERISRELAGVVAAATAARVDDEADAASEVEESVPAATDGSANA
jgi:cell division septum initiation protein DivIVA